MIGTIRRVLQEHVQEQTIIDGQFRWFCKCGEDLTHLSLIDHQARQISFALLPLLDAYEEWGWDRAHEEALGCDSQSCDVVHGADEADTNPIRKYSARS